jgi:hypothetical protein
MKRSRNTSEIDGIILSTNSWYPKLYKCAMVTMILHILIIIQWFFSYVLVFHDPFVSSIKSYLHNSAVQVPCQKPLATSIQIATPFWSCAEDYIPLNITVLWDVTLCTGEDSRGGRFHQISGNDLPDCTISHLRRQVFIFIAGRTSDILYYISLLFTFCDISSRGHTVA